jgi:uncharacterized protein (TIGR02186 family)
VRRWLLAVFFALAPVAARADSITADLSSHAIAVGAGFTGASVVLFGATDGPADVIAVMRGPEHDETVWRKGKIAGVWTNADSVTFANVPGFYGIAASRPIDDIISPAAAALHRIGVANLKFETQEAVSPERAKLFTDALIDVQKQAGVFSPSHIRLYFLGDRLFRTIFTLPANTPTGNYLVEVFLIRDKGVVTGQTTPLIVSRVGVDATVFDFAQRSPLTYGAIAVIIAVMAGWLANLPFRNA